MALTVLNVAYPLAPVGRAAVGGAEQVLTELDAGLDRAGQHSIVVACEGSRVAGTLVSVPRASGPIDDREIEAARIRHRRAIVAALERWPIDVVHLHGVDFDAYLPPPGVPVLATLHLPVDWYSPNALSPQRPDTWLNCVSRSQHAACPKGPHLLAPIENGVDVDLFSIRHAKRSFALMLSRICPEKGVHLAVAASRSAVVPLLIAGEVFPYGAHQRYFKEQVQPNLDRWRRFIGPVGLLRKRRLLSAARCVLLPSLVDETSSLVAREALASGTPVVAFARGALVETIDHGVTGFLVHDDVQMAKAIARTSEINPEACRGVARARFSLDRMIKRYIALYEALAQLRGRSLAVDVA
jgi:glycosyltransferase involved in cell wall biosynthesis